MRRKKVNYVSPTIERHLVINGVTITDTGHNVDVVWQWHVASCAQTDVAFVRHNQYIRNNVRYVIWVSGRIGKIPTERAMKALVKEHYEYTLNPFGLGDFGG